MAELVYALVLGTSGATLGSSSLPPGTKYMEYILTDSKAGARRCEAGSQAFLVKKDL